MRNKILERLGLFVGPSQFDAARCAEFCEAMRVGPADKSEIERPDRSVQVDETERRSLSVQLPAGYQDAIQSYFESLRPVLEAWFELTLRPAETPHYLVYQPGAFFAPHRDRPLARNLETSDRIISIVMFLNTGYTGGVLTFYGLLEGKDWEDKGFPCDPAPGLVVAFRSTTLHEVTPVTSGNRFSIVSWYS